MEFVAHARNVKGVIRIALIGSILTDKKAPKDIDLLVNVSTDIDIKSLAARGRQMKGKSQTLNLGADIFLSSIDNQYIGRLCRYRDCHPRVSCQGADCRPDSWICTDLRVIKIHSTLIESPPLVVWPKTLIGQPLPDDVIRIALHGGADKI